MRWIFSLCVLCLAFSTSYAQDAPCKCGIACECATTFTQFGQQMQCEDGVCRVVNVAAPLGARTVQATAGGCANGSCGAVAAAGRGKQGAFVTFRQHRAEIRQQRQAARRR